MKPYNDVQKILDGFKDKIDGIGKHKKAAKGVAEQLYKDLVELNQKTLGNPANSEATASG